MDPQLIRMSVALVFIIVVLVLIPAKMLIMDAKITAALEKEDNDGIS